jgi:hypothetical protein
MDPLMLVIGGVLLILLIAALTQPKDPPPCLGGHPKPAISRHRKTGH